MNPHEAVAALAVLGHEIRLAIIRELLGRGAGGLPAGEIGETFDVSPSALTFHLNRLKQVGLVSARRTGQQIIYRAAFKRMSALVTFLGDTCCRDVATGCVPQCAGLRRTGKTSKKRVKN